MTAPDATNPADLGLLEAAALLRSGRLSAVELLEACQARIASRNGGAPTFDGALDAINAWVRLYPELARAAAMAADERLAREGASAPRVCGIPFGVKDLIGVAGVPLTGSSRVLEANVPDADSPAWRRLRERGAVLAGHTHTHEFGAGGTTDQVGNPWDVSRTAGGSSGGSAAALVSGMVPAALGTDTAGSVRIPASMSGVSSIKATYARVPYEGCLPLSQTFDHVGPMARSVADCVPVLAALAREPGSDVDPVVEALPVAARPGPRPLAGLRIAVTDRPDAAGVTSEVGAVAERAREACAALGAEVISVSAAPGMSAEDAFLLLFHEAWIFHAAFADRADRYRPSIREFVRLASETHDAVAYEAAQARRGAMTAGWRAWFDEQRVDALLEPTVPMTAHPRGDGYDPEHLGGEGDPLIVLTSTWNFAGFPVVTLPGGLGDESGLPVAVSLIAPHDCEPVIVQAGIDLQEHALPAPRWEPA